MLIYFLHFLDKYNKILQNARYIHQDYTQLNLYWSLRNQDCHNDSSKTTPNIGQFSYSLLPLLSGPLCNKQNLVVYSCSGVSDLHVFHSHRWRMELACGDMRTWGIHAGCPILSTRNKNINKSELKFKLKTQFHKTCRLQHGCDGNILIPCICYCCKMKWFRGYFKRNVYVSFLWYCYPTKFQSILHIPLQW
jgi:hypothetical protein